VLRRILDSPRTYYILAGLLVLAALATRVRITIPTRPHGSIEDLAALRARGDLNVVFVLIDTLRADRLGAYGYRRPTSPLLDELAASGIRFARVSSQSSWTKCSMASLWTGLFPPRTGILRFDDALPEAARMPAEIFREAGYETAGIWRNGWVAPNFGFGQGFDTYIRPAPRKQEGRVQKQVPGAIKLPGTDEDITLAAREFLRNYRHRKFLLYLHYMDVHQYAYDQEAAKLDFGATISDVYDRSIHWVDRNLAALYDELEKLHLSERTIFVVAADHGEAFMEHGVEGHARNLFQEVVQVPLFIGLPFRLEHELVVEPLVRNVDIWPTLLDLVGLPPLPDTDGISLVPLIQAAARGEQPATPPAIAYLDQTWGQTKAAPSPLGAIQQGEHRLLFNTTRPKRSLEIFDHTTDPGEKRNLRRKPPPWAKELQPLLERPWPPGRPGGRPTTWRSTTCTGPSCAPSATW